jgi:hypothetical protein
LLAAAGRVFEEAVRERQRSAPADYRPASGPMQTQQPVQAQAQRPSSEVKTHVPEPARPPAPAAAVHASQTHGSAVTHAAQSPAKRPTRIGPTPGIFQPGFVDNRQGANVRTSPAEQTMSQEIAYLPPCAPVFVSGHFPGYSEWLYITTIVNDQLQSGYVQDFRINRELPEPLATLYQIAPGDRLEPIAARIYRHDVIPGRDLRFYERAVYTSTTSGVAAGSMKTGDWWRAIGSGC